MLKIYYFIKIPNKKENMSITLKDANKPTPHFSTNSPQC